MGMSFLSLFRAHFFPHILGKLYVSCILEQVYQVCHFSSLCFSLRLPIYFDSGKQQAKTALKVLWQLKILKREHPLQLHRKTFRSLFKDNNLMGGPWRINFISPVFFFFTGFLKKLVKFSLEHITFDDNSQIVNQYNFKSHHFCLKHWLPIF